MVYTVRNPKVNPNSLKCSLVNTSPSVAAGTSAAAVAAKALLIKVAPWRRRPLTAANTTM